jgi:hypothetical protein
MLRPANATQLIPQSMRSALAQRSVTAKVVIPCCGWGCDGHQTPKLTCERVQ